MTLLKRMLLETLAVAVLIVVLTMGVVLWHTRGVRFDAATWRAAVGQGGPERRCEIVCKRCYKELPSSTRCVCAFRVIRRS